MPRGLDKVPIVPDPGGVAEIANPADLPRGKFAVVHNWISREKTLRPRPGYALIGSQLASADDVTGIGFRGSIFNEARLVVHTITTANAYNGTSFSDVTGTWTTASTDEPVRMVPFNQGGTTYLLRINPSNAIDEYNGTGNFTDTSGSPPTGRDLVISSGRVVVMAANGDPNRIQWSDFNDRTGWGAANFTLQQDTAGGLVGAQPFSALSFAAYKDDAVIIATATADSLPFQFQTIHDIQGPVSPAAIISWRGLHYWFGHDGNVYQFDGSRVRPFASDLAKTITNTLDWANRAKSHGMVLPLTEPQLIFFYPDANNSGLLTRGLAINLLTEQQQTLEFSHSITASRHWTSQPGLTIDELTGTIDDLDLQYSSIDAMGSAATRSSILGESAGYVDRFNTAFDDRGTDYSWEIDPGWRALVADFNDFYFDGVQSYWVKESNSKTVTVGLKVTQSVNDAESETTDTFDLSTDAQHFSAFPDLRGKWARTRFTGTGATATMQFRGGLLLGWNRKMRGP